MRGDYPHGLEISYTTTAPGLAALQCGCRRHHERRDGAVLMLFLGWLVSSSEARSFLGSVPFRWQLSSGLVLSYAVFYGLWTWTWYRRPESTHKQLIALRYMPRERYEALRIRKYLALTLISIQVAGCMTAAYFLYSLRA
jgi:hypothetical protein